MDIFTPLPFSFVQHKETVSVRVQDTPFRPKIEHQN